MVNVFQRTENVFRGRVQVEVESLLPERYSRVVELSCTFWVVTRTWDLQDDVRVRGVDWSENGYDHWIIYFRINIRENNDKFGCKSSKIKLSKDMEINSLNNSL